MKIISVPFDPQKYVDTTIKEIVSNKKLKYRHARIDQLKKDYPKCKFPENIEL